MYAILKENTLSDTVAKGASLLLIDDKKISRIFLY